MARYRPQLPDFNASYTHQCNSLASYEQKKNPDPKKLLQSQDQLDKTGSTVMAVVQKKTTFEVKNEFGATLEDLKKFSKPNLDEGNRYFEDNLNFQNKFQNLHVQTQQIQRGGSSRQQRKVNQTVAVTHDKPVASRSYQKLGYTPKKYAVRTKTAVQKQYEEIQADLATKSAFEKQKDIERMEAQNKRNTVQFEMEIVKDKQNNQRQEQAQAPPQDWEFIQVCSNCKSQVEADKARDEAVVQRARVQAALEAQQNQEPPRTHYTVFQNEQEHPFSQYDSRNQFVQHNLKVAEDNLADPYWATCYRHNYKAKELPTRTRKNMYQNQNWSIGGKV